LGLGFGVRDPTIKNENTFKTHTPTEKLEGSAIDTLRELLSFKALKHGLR